MMMGQEQEKRLMALLSRLDALDSGDPSAVDERDRRIKSFNFPEFQGQEHNDAKTLLHIGWIRSRHFGMNGGNTWSNEGIYAFDLTGDGKAALEVWHASNGSNRESIETLGALRQQSRPRVMLIHGSQDGQVPPIVDTIRLWCFDYGLDARKAADHPNAGRFVHDKVDAVINESDYYIVVLTADEELKTGAFRPRPNAMIEMGRLLEANPGRVCVLKEEKVEMPSDYTGFLTEPLDQWESVLVRELKNVGLL